MSSDGNLQQQATSASTSSFVTALVLNAAIFGAEIVAFTILRRSFPAIYEPRSRFLPEGKRQRPLGDGLLSWPITIFKANHEDIKMHNGMDAYFFVRFLRMMVRIFLPFWLVSWVILLPVDAAGVNNKDGLDQFTFGNIPGNSQVRYAAHLILAWIGTFWVMFNIKKEMRNFVEQRQRHLVDPIHSASTQANTVLITGVPGKFLDEAVLAQLFQHVPGGVKKVWLNRDLKELPEVYDRRTAATNKLEGAEFKLVAIAQKLHRKHTLALAKAAKKGQDITSVKSPVSDADLESPAVADRHVPRSERPTHRLPPFKWLPFGLPFMGEKVDTIEWARKEVVESDKLLQEGREKLAADRANIGVNKDENYPPLNSAFILFNQQIGAHVAAQILLHNQPYRMAEKYTEVAPADVIWGNLGLNPYEARIRKAASYAATAALIIFWAIPVSFVGIVSNVAQLCVQYRWMQWLCKLPDVVVGIISGILPPVALAILMMLLPIILRLLARFEGIPRFTGLELSLMTRYFIFQVIHSFLIVTLSSGIIAALPQLASNPTSIPTILAQKLPEASTFFLTYAILQGLAGSAGGLLQIVPLVLYYVKLYILGSTPRSIYNIKYSLRNVAWGTLFPSMTLITVIGLAYSIISPIINGLVFLAFFLFYQVWKYLFLWQYGQPEAGDTGGLFFPKAMQHIFVGLYIEQICLCALFFLSRDDQGRASAIPQGALMIVLIVITAGYQFIINDSYNGLLHALPLTLAHKSHGMPKEHHPSQDEDLVRDEDDMRERDFGRQSSSDSARRPLNKDGQPLTAEQQAKLDQLQQEHAEHEMQARTAPRKTEKYGKNVAEEGKRNDGPEDFEHPAAVEPQRVVWLPKDPLGVAEAEERELKQQGIEVSTENAVMDEKGHVELTGAPPGGDDDALFG
ncbi:RSN1-overexpression rescues sro7/sop1 in NaCl-like protein, putative [Rhizoctonia solani AG-3 Rhs1AP]|nr:RSN1-overexpression rescues sro7/sop1 in NaCl-like protein, putative [Rhizoctonia solani AG-3 Rhs1AP]KEP49360.1 putative RSN1-overexpression rescues sro7/sop1 in NaCl-like protein [Rhizoctonia solani 123E]